MTGRWAALVGRGRDGRVSAAWSLVASLRVRGARIGGFIEECVGERVDAVDIETGRRRRLAERSEIDPDVCDWRFDRDTLQTLQNQLMYERCDVFFAYAGRAESYGRGVWPALVDRIGRGDSLVTVSSPQSSLTRIALELPDPVAGLVLPASGPSLSWFGSELFRMSDARQEAAPMLVAR